jgi:CBS domain-containing protein
LSQSFPRQGSNLAPGQGYRLTIDPLGSRALKACLPERLYDLVVATSGTLGDRFTIYDQKKRVLRQVDFPHAADAADIDVSKLTDRLLLRLIPLAGLGDAVHFGKTGSHYASSGSSVTVHFADGTRAAGALLVGAEGIDSRVRRQLVPQAAFRDTGARAIFGRTPLRIDGEQVLADEMIGNGALVVAPERHALFFTNIRLREPPEEAAARVAPEVDLPPREDYVTWAVVFSADDQSTAESDGAVTLKDLAVAYAEMFPPEFARIVERADAGGRRARSHPPGRAGRALAAGSSHPGGRRDPRNATIRRARRERRPAGRQQLGHAPRGRRARRARSCLGGGRLRGDDAAIRVRRRQSRRSRDAGDARITGGDVMQCSDLMRTDVQTVGESDSIRQAAERMSVTNVGFLPVCDESSKVLGTVTDRDILIRAVAAAAIPEVARVGDVMSRSVVCCRPDDDLDLAEQIMAQHQVSRIVLTDDGGLLAGVISLSDIAENEAGLRTADLLRDITAREAPRLT